MSCACEELTLKGLPPPAGWKCGECGVVGIGPHDPGTVRSLEDEWIARVEAAFDYAEMRWRQGGRDGRSFVPHYEFTRDYVLYYLKNPESA